MYLYLSEYANSLTNKWNGLNLKMISSAFEGKKIMIQVNTWVLYKTCNKVVTCVCMYLFWSLKFGTFIIEKNGINNKVMLLYE